MINHNQSVIEKLQTVKYRIWDSHCHLGGYYKFHYPDHDADSLVKVMNLIGVEKIAISSLACMESDYMDGNDRVACAIRRYPSRFIGMAFINANRPSEVLPELKRCFPGLGMSMIKLHPEFTECPIHNPNYLPVFEFAAQKRLCILNHCWEDPDYLESIVSRYPEINYIQAHNAGFWDGHKKDPFIELARQYDNIYLDIAYSKVFYNAFETLVDYVGADKILYGSDFPFINMGFEIGKVLLSDIGEEEKKLILGANFERILNCQISS